MWGSKKGKRKKRDQKLLTNKEDTAKNSIAYGRIGYLGSWLALDSFSMRLGFKDHLSASHNRF